MQRQEWTRLLQQKAARAQLWRMPGWTARVGIVLDGDPYVTVQPQQDRLVVAPWATDGGPNPTTSVSVTSEAIERWLVGGVDFTHLVKAGGMRVLSGTYFDVLLLSKALRLRPEITRAGAA